MKNNWFSAYFPETAYEKFILQQAFKLSSRSQPILRLFCLPAFANSFLIQMTWHNYQMEIFIQALRMISI